MNHACVRKRKQWLRTAIAAVGGLVLAVACAGPARAADAPATAKPFSLVTEPFMLAQAPAPASDPKTSATNNDFVLITSMGAWLTFITGDAAVGDLQAEVDWDIGDVLSDLKFAIFPGFEVRKDKWALIFNGAYAKLGDDVPIKPNGPGPGVVDNKAEITMEVYLADVAVGYRLLDIPLGTNSGNEMMLSIMPTVGVRYVYLSLEIDPELEETQSGHQDWWDPTVGGRVNLQFNDNLAWRNEGSVGGFGVGSEFTWSAQTTLDWRFRQNWELSVGYRAIGWDYENGDAQWNMIMHGPWIDIRYYWN